MERRVFLSSVVAAAAASRPLTALSAPPPGDARRIAIIDDGPLWDYFRERLRELGDVGGKPVLIEYRTADGDPGRVLAAAREIVHLPVDALVVAGSTAAKAAQSATDKVPIVAIRIGDPVAIGLAQSRTRPGGNITGNMTIAPDLAAKRLQLLKNILLKLGRVAYFWNPNNASSRAFLDQLRAAARPLGVTIVPVEARAAAEFERAFGAIANSHADAMITSGDVVQQQNTGAIIDFQRRHRLPGMFTRREDVAAGGLLSYGISVPDLYRRGAETVHKILRGARPADLPFEPPSRFELAINLLAARALGVTIPAPIVAAADEVVENDEE